jgi:hypothetical protein
VETRTTPSTTESILKTTPSMTVVWKSNRFHLKAENNLRGHCSFPTFFKDHSFFPIATNLSVSLSLSVSLWKNRAVICGFINVIGCLFGCFKKKERRVLVVVAGRSSLWELMRVVLYFNEVKSGNIFYNHRVFSSNSEAWFFTPFCRV